MKADNTTVCWGLGNDHGGEICTFKDVKSIHSTHGAFAAIHFDGTVSAWSNTRYGGGRIPQGMTDVKFIFSAFSTFTALTDYGQVISWSGEYQAPINAPSNLRDIITVYAAF